MRFLALSLQRLYLSAFHSLKKVN
ncbi:UNVERIFIED_CONTAM: hypothetical protein GTU68_026293 [Idotea baltica]|nr:hypothetical protein [Idotea baltica]